MNPIPLPAAFMAKTKPAAGNLPELGPCWLWTAAKSSTGYGMAWNGRTVVGAHVFAYERAVGPINPGLHIDHLCRTPLCVNPRHLEPVTPGENVRRGNSPSATAARTGICPQGHPLTDDNVTIVRCAPRLKRRCKACHRARQARYDAARKGQ